MTRQHVDTLCASLPGAHWASHHEGGLDAWKVGPKIFAIIGMKGDGVSLKCADVDSAQFLIDIGAAYKAPYLHRSWIRIPIDGTDADEMRDRIHASYSLIRAGLPKKLQATLGPWRTGA